MPHWQACRLTLIVLVAACGGKPTLAQQVMPGGHGAIQRPQGAQLPPEDLKFGHLTTDDGLSHNTVVDILQDRRGFMWFATAEGLNRYDGHAFGGYKHDPEDPGSISDNAIRDLMEDGHGNLLGGRVSRCEQIRPHDRTHHSLPARPQEPE